MSHQLLFAQLLSYDASRAGIGIDVALSLNGDLLRCTAKLDTGSTFCLFARKIGEDLGIEIESGIRQVVGTVTGTFVVYLHEVNLIVADSAFGILAGFAESEAFQRNVLGRHGFLEQTILGLVDYEGKLYLGKYGEE